MLKNRVSVSSLSKNRWIKRLLPAWSRSGSWADAASESESDHGSVSGPVSSEPALKHELVQQLYKVIDPELGVNIVDLGLVYAINIDNGQVSVRFTTTTPGCPMRRYLQQQVEKAVSSLPGVDDYEVEMVMEPAWSVEMIKDGVEFFSVPPPPRQLDPE